MSAIPTLCLNMIVKNESKIILRLLESVHDLLDSFCIVDTGSTDNTIEIITNFFHDKEISGKILQHPFKDFGFNRTHALNACTNMDKADYILLLDADMIIIRNKSISNHDFKYNLKGGDNFYVLQGNDVLYYQNTRIVRNNIGVKYWGCTHEYVSFPAENVVKKIAKEDFFIHDIGDGGSKYDKTERDIRLLEQGLIDIPNNDRYTFYLANSYRDIKEYDKAIEIYKKRIEIGGWVEEIWYSHYMIGKLYYAKGFFEKSIFHFLEAYNVQPRRIENLHLIVKHYREKCNYDLAYNFYRIADVERKKTTWDFLFTEKDVYDFKLDYELTIIGYYCNDSFYDLKNICMRVMTYPNLQDNLCKNVLSNYKFYSDAIVNNAISIPKHNIDVLNSIGSKFNFFKPHFNSSTPTISFGKTMNELFVCVRFVNYHISENGDYIRNTKIITKNVVATIDISSAEWIKIDESLLGYNSSIDDSYVGQEDIRILRTDNLVPHHSYTCNRCNQDNLIKVEYGKIEFQNDNYNAIDSTFLIKDKENEIEKNWCLFDDSGTTKCVYGWCPLLIGNITGETFIETHSFEKMPTFFKYLRGSTNGIIVDDEIWFICHIVSYEDRRYYYHVVVVLDKNTFNLKKFTHLFTFEKQKVEYTLGFLYFESQNNFLISYSLMDKESKYCYISKDSFNNMMVG